MNSNIFDLQGSPHTNSEAKIALIGVPWEGTVSYHAGTAKGPKAIIDASEQIDLADPEILDAPPYGIVCFEDPLEIESLQMQLNKTSGKNARVKIANQSAKKIENALFEWTSSQDRCVGVIGGEHSVPLGAIRAKANQHHEIGILQIDAHMDLRDCYQGYEQSHASIMHNVITGVRGVTRLHQVGIRDFCAEEVGFAQAHSGKVNTFFDRDLALKKSQGESWMSLCSVIVQELPNKVWVSFDIDGLDPSLCPSTGTPVPGGLSFYEAVFLIREVVQSGRQIIGFDLCEVAPDPDGSNDWDANVGMRVLYQLCIWAGQSMRST